MPSQRLMREDYEPCPTCGRWSKYVGPCDICRAQDRKDRFLIKVLFVGMGLGSAALGALIHNGASIGIQPF
eukprot:g45807.t1